MAELEKINIYACALSMPSPDNPVCSEWVDEISRHVERNGGDEIYLVGHSLGVPAILRYLERAPKEIKIMGIVLVSGPSESKKGKKTYNFLNTPFDFDKIKSKVSKFVIIHGDNDPYVPLHNAEFFSKELNGELIIVPNGGHLNGPSGCLALPQCLEALKGMFK